MGKNIQQTFGGKNIFKFLLVSLFPNLSEKLKIKITNDEADRFLSKLVVDALNHRQETNEKRDDFLQLMLEARQGKLKEEDESQLDEYEKAAKLKDAPKDAKIAFDDDLIIAQSLIFFLGGFDTMDTFFSFAVYELGVHEDVQEKLYEEVKAAVEKNGGEFSYDIINSLEYLDMVVSETLRKYPAGVRTERKCNKAYKVPGSDLSLEPNTIVVIPTYAIHHDPEHYPNPERFDPLRFTKENVSKRHPYAYQPFGHGPRNCIGNRFALSEAKVALAQLVLNFRLEPCKKTVIPLVLANQALLKPADEICLKVTPRN
jgi:cytochrome P450